MHPQEKSEFCRCRDEHEVGLEADAQARHRPRHDGEPCRHRDTGNTKRQAQKIGGDEDRKEMLALAECVAGQNQECSQQNGAPPRPPPGRPLPMPCQPQAKPAREHCHRHHQHAQRGVWRQPCPGQQGCRQQTQRCHGRIGADEVAIELAASQQAVRDIEEPGNVVVEGIGATQCHGADDHGKRGQITHHRRATNMMFLPNGSGNIRSRPRVRGTQTLS